MSYSILAQVLYQQLYIIIVHMKLGLTRGFQMSLSAGQPYKVARPRNSCPRIVLNLLLHEHFVKCKFVCKNLGKRTALSKDQWIGDMLEIF